MAIINKKRNLMAIRSVMMYGTILHTSILYEVPYTNVRSRLRKILLLIFYLLMDSSYLKSSQRDIYIYIYP